MSDTPTTPRRFKTRGNYLGDPDRHWEEVTPQQWDRLNDANREILQVAPGDTAFVRRIPHG